MTKWIISAIAFVVIVIIVCCAVPKKKPDIPYIGDSNIAFTITDYHNYDSDYSKFEGSCIYDADLFTVYIVNPSPQKQKLQLTNIQTGQVFTVTSRDYLTYDNYRIEVKSLDGKIISTHDLKIERPVNP